MHSVENYHFHPKLLFSSSDRWSIARHCKYAAWIYHLSDITLVQKTQTSELEMEAFNSEAFHGRTHTHTLTHKHTHSGSLSTPCCGLTAVQCCRIQTTQISCRMRSLQYVGNQRWTTYQTFYPLKHLHQCVFHWEYSKPSIINIQKCLQFTRVNKSSRKLILQQHTSFLHMHTWPRAFVWLEHTCVDVWECARTPTFPWCLLSVFYLCSVSIGVAGLRQVVFDWPLKRICERWRSSG